MVRQIYIGRQSENLCSSFGRTSFDKCHHTEWIMKEILDKIREAIKGLKIRKGASSGVNPVMASTALSMCSSCFVAVLNVKSITNFMNRKKSSFFKISLLAHGA
jgi:hypothetical protein